MIGGLPDATARAIGEAIVFALELAVGGILAAAVLAGVLAWQAGRARPAWARRMRVAAWLIAAVDAVVAACLVTLLSAQ